ncbi:unnamed protein product, partial [Porites evermanni]
MNTNFFALAILLTLISSYLNNVSGQRQRCLGNYCSGSYRMGAVCKDGYCVCNSQDYDYNTCLPDAYGCKIEVNSATALAKPNNQQQLGYSTYSCTPSSSSTQHEVHVLSVYEVINRRPPTAGNANVNIVSRGKSNRPIVLVLASYEPVNWILHLPAGISISKIVLVAYYLNKSSVSGDLNQVQAIERKSYRNSEWPRGYGSDSGGGNTVGLLKEVYNRFGVVTSFTGTYRANEWSLVIRSSSGTSTAAITPTPTAVGTPASTPIPTYTTSPSPTPNPHRQKCLFNVSYCPGSYKMNTVCKDGYCVCTGQGYNYDTCLPDAYGCKIEVNSATAFAKTRYNNQQRQTTYSCTPGSSSTQYEVHILSVYEAEAIHRRPPVGENANVNIVIRGKPNRPIVLVLASYEPVNWILNLPSGISISKVILVSYYLDESSVSGDVKQVQAIERKRYRNSEWPRGYGSDSGGGNTVGLLKKVYNRFGVVTSFTGTYRANEWSLVIRSSNGTTSVFFAGRFTLSQSSPPARNATYLRTFFLNLFMFFERFCQPACFFAARFTLRQPKTPVRNATNLRTFCSGYGNLSSSSAVAAITETPTAAGTPTPSSAATITPTPTVAGTPASTPVPTYSTSPSPTPNPHRQKCYKWQNSFYCTGQYTRRKAVCKDGYCVCTGQGYNYDTCLPDAYGCKIEVNSATALAKPNNQQQQGYSTYSCTPSSSSTQYEVHVLSVYEVINRRPPTAGNANVNIVSRGKSNRPIVLVLASYESVNWILHLPVGISISKVVLVSYYLDKSSVSGDVNQVKAIERKSYHYGYGSDSGGGNTVELLKKVYNRFGVVTSFTGTYIADEWSLVIRSSSGTSAATITPTPTAAGTPASTPVPTYSTSLSPTPNPHRQKCYKWQNSFYCTGQYTRRKAVCKDGYCVCTGQGYNYDTCLPDGYGCKIEVNSATALAKARYNNQQRPTTYSCTPGSSSTQYEVHILSVYEAEAIHRRPPVGENADVNIVSRGKSNRPIVLVLGSYEPVNWVLHLPVGISISKVILVSYYLDESSVSGDVKQVQAIERKSYRNSEWPRGYGSDSGGGDTVGLLKKVYNRFGVVTSFTGTYRANEWSLVIRSSNGTSAATITPAPTVAGTPVSTPVPTYSTSPSPTPNPHRQKCYKWQNSFYCTGQYSKMKAVCKDGYCVCTGQGYNYDTCLPDGYGCKIEVNSATALAKARYNNQQRPTTYSCTPGSSSTQYEVHILSVYEAEAIHRRPPVGENADVNIVSRGKSNRPIVLVLGSYEPVNWVLHLPVGISISKVILVSYYLDESSVSGDVKQVQAIERKSYRNSEWPRGYGSDSGGGDTVGLLKKVYNRFGVVTSFTGTYRANEWSLVIRSSNGSGYGNLSSSSAVAAITQTPTAAGTPTPSSAATITPAPTVAGTPVSTPVPTYSTSPSPTPNPHRQKCYKWQNSFYCTGQYSKMKAVCKDGYCVCTGQGYNYDTCLPDVYGCKIEVNSATALAKPRYNNQQRQTTYSCTPDSSSTQYEVHVLSVYEVINRRPPTAGNAIVNIVSPGKSKRPIVLVLGSYEPVNWILNLPAGISISNVVLVS